VRGPRACAARVRAGCSHICVPGAGGRYGEVRDPANTPCSGYANSRECKPPGRCAGMRTAARSLALRAQACDHLVGTGGRIREVSGKVAAVGCWEQ